jgi:hypothetical protein
VVQPLKGFSTIQAEGGATLARFFTVWSEGGATFMAKFSQTLAKSPKWKMKNEPSALCVTPNRP